MTWEVWFWKQAQCSFINKKQFFGLLLSVLGAQQLSKTQITDANLFPTHSSDLSEKQETLLCLRDAFVPATLLWVGLKIMWNKS